MSHRSNEPLLWAPFSAGMMIDALTIPALVLITGLLIPFGVVTMGIRGLILLPLTRLVLFVIISLSFFHAAHRLRYALSDLGLKGMKGALVPICYGAAIVGTAWAAGIALGLL